MNINKLIEKATLEKNKIAKEAYRAIKSEILLNNSSKKPKPEGKVVNILDLNINGEINSFTITELDLSIIRKLIKQREESALIYETNNRGDLALEERNQIKYLKELLPPEISENKIKELILASFPVGYSIKEIGKVIQTVKKIYPTVDAKKVSEIVKSYLI